MLVSDEFLETPPDVLRAQANHADLLARVRERIHVAETGCWLWTSSINPHTGYGVIKIDGKLVGAHRVTFELFVGPIPPGAFICHHCDVRECVNPEHLFAGTPAENQADMIAKGRARRPGPVLSKRQITDIRQWRRAGVGQLALSRQFGVSVPTIRKIVNGVSHAG